MPNSRNAIGRNAGLLQTLVFSLLIALFIFVPLFRAGATPLAELVAQLLALIVLILMLWTPRTFPLTRKEMLVVALLLLLPLVHLIPLPPAWAAALPGRALYVHAGALLGLDPAHHWQPMSVVPLATASAVLSLLLPIAVFIGTRALDTRRLVTLAKLLIVIAVLQALLGVVQFQTAQTGEVIFAVEGASGLSGTGTYANRNHLAGLIEMVLPITLALFFYSVGRGGSDGASGGIWKRRAAFLGSKEGNIALALGIAAFVLLLGVVFTRSRAGISLTMLGILLSAMLFSRRIGGSNVYGLAGTVTVIAIAIAVAIGLAPVLDRFSVEDVADDARFSVFAATLLGIGLLFPVGSGPGTFPDVFLRFQPLETGRAFVNRAHNDYLEWVFDGGIIAAVLILLVLALYVYQWSRVYTREEWSRGRYLQVGAGISLLLLGLHEIVDYNLYTPANQLVFAFLAGIFFIPPSVLDGAKPEKRRRHREAPDEPEQTKARPEVSPPSVPTDQIENPFRTP